MAQRQKGLPGCLCKGYCTGMLYRRATRHALCCTGRAVLCLVCQAFPVKTAVSTGPDSLQAAAALPKPRREGLARESGERGLRTQGPQAALQSGHPRPCRLSVFS